MHRYRVLLLCLLTILILSLNTVYASDTSAFSPDALTLLNVSPQPGAADVNSNTRKITLMFDRSVVPVTALGQAQGVSFEPILIPTATAPAQVPQLGATGIIPTVQIGGALPTPTQLILMPPQAIMLAPNLLTPVVVLPTPTSVVPPLTRIVRSATPHVLSITPAVEGVGMWVHPAVYEFTLADKALMGGKTYEVSIDPDLQAVDGTRLEEPFHWSFTVIEPQVIDIVPTHGSKDGVWLESGFRISFSQSMDRVTTEAAFTLYKNLGGACGDGCSTDPSYWEPIEGTFAWDVANTQMTFKPSQRLEYSQSTYDPKYRAELRSTARNAAGTSLMAGGGTYFRTIFPPYVTGITPSQGGSVPPGTQRVTISFGGRVDTESYRDHYQVEPVPPGGITPYVNPDSTLSLEFDHALDETYTVTMLAGVKDVYGTEMKEPYCVTYTVREPRPEVSFYLVMPSNQYLAIANPALGRPAVTLQVTGNPEIAVEIYKADVDMLLQSNQEYSQYSSSYYNFLSQLYAPMTRWTQYDAHYSEKLYLPWIQPDRLVSRTLHQLETQDPKGEQVALPLWAEKTDPLPLGLYGVDVNGSSGFMLGVANAAVTLKRSHDELMVWVTDYDTTQPLPGMSVKVQGLDATTVGRTDADGIARFPMNANSGLVFVTAEDEEHFGVWYSQYGSGVPGTTPYFYTDRSIYRPGETVYYRGILRDRDDFTYTVPSDIEHVYVNITTYCYDFTCRGATTLYQAERPLTDFGTFSDSFVLPDNLKPNHYTLQMSTCPPDQQDCQARYSQSISFQVAEYRVPDFTVALTPQQDEVVSGEAINVDVSATYYSGSVMGLGELTRIGSGYSTPFVYQGTDKGFTFGDSDVGGRAEIYAPDERLPMGANGHFLLTDAPIAAGSYPVRLSVEATIFDGSGQGISGRTSLIVHPTTAYIGVRATPQNASSTIPIDLLAIFPDSTTRPNQSFTLQIVGQRWLKRETSFGSYEWYMEESAITNFVSKTDAKGQYTYNFVPPRPGTYRVRVKTIDEQGRVGQSATTFTATGASGGSSAPGNPLIYVGCEVGEPITRLNIISDQQEYAPGDTAELTFQNPYGVPVQALITIERQGIYKEEVISISGESYTYHLPLEGRDSPNVVLGVVLMRPSTLATKLPVFIRGSIFVNVDNRERRLTVEISPSTTQAAPGDEVTFDLRVTDAHGKPVSSELGIALVDEAVKDLYYNSRPSFESHYYHGQSSNVITASSAIALLQGADVTLVDYCGRGGGGGGNGIRRDYETTPLWSPHVVTDENGAASVSVKMPDNLTSWEIEALAITSETQVGEARATLTTSLPLTARAIAPRFFVVGDQLPLAAIVQNNTDKPLSITVTLETKGFSLRDDNAIQTLELDAYALSRVEWWGTAQAVDGIYMAVSAVADNGLSDASIPTLTTGEGDTIPVYTFDAVETVTFSGLLDQAVSRTESFDLALDPMPRSGDLSLEFAPTLAGSLIAQAINVPSRYASDEMPLFSTASQLRLYTAVLGLDTVLTPESHQMMQDQIPQYLNQLGDSQNYDGGWGWYKGMASDPKLTAEVVIGLAQAESLGISSDVSMREDALAYLLPLVVPPLIDTPAAEMEWQVSLLYVLSLYQKADQEDLDHLFDARLELSVAAHAQLTLAYLNTAPEAAQLASLMSDLTDQAIISGTSVHWEEAASAYAFGDTRTTALVLVALLKANPRHPLAANAVRWLITAREGNPGNSGDETLWMIAALGEWLRQTGEASPDYTFAALLNGNIVAQNQFSASSDIPTQWTTPLADLRPNTENNIVIQRSEGEGVLYYEGTLSLTYDAEAVGPVDRGIRIEREYLRDVDRQPLTSVWVGDVVVVRLTLYVAQDVYYFTLEDTLPAGLEPLDPLLLTTTRQGETPRLQSTDRNNPYWYWGGSYWGRTQLYDTGIRLQSTFLPRGVYTYTYQARAVTPGEFMVPPSLAFAAQQPDIKGRTASDRLLISVR